MPFSNKHLWDKELNHIEVINREIKHWWANRFKNGTRKKSLITDEPLSRKRYKEERKEKIRNRYSQIQYLKGKYKLPNSEIIESVSSWHVCMCNRIVKSDLVFRLKKRTTIWSRAGPVLYGKKKKSLCYTVHIERLSKPDHIALIGVFAYLYLLLICTQSQSQCESCPGIGHILKTVSICC